MRATAHCPIRCQSTAMYVCAHRSSLLCVSHSFLCRRYSVYVCVGVALSTVQGRVRLVVCCVDPATCVLRATRWSHTFTRYFSATPLCRCRSRPHLFSFLYYLVSNGKKRNRKDRSIYQKSCYDCTIVCI